MAQSVVSQQANGDFFSINWGWGVAVMLGVYVSGGVSGGHLNPAVTLAMALRKKLEWKKVPVYFLAQYLGAFLGAALVYFVYYGKTFRNAPKPDLPFSHGNLHYFPSYRSYFQDTDLLGN